MKRSSHLKPYYLTVLALFGIAFFVLWLLRVMLPIAILELRYQATNILVQSLGITDLRGLIVPQFKVDMKASMSKYTKDGITIPAIFIDESVIYNVDPNDAKQYSEALKKGIAHASGTAFPGAGGMGYYFAHSSTPSFVSQYNAVFYLLHKLEIQDEIYVFHDGKRYDYAVYAKQIVDPKDTAFLRYKNTAETIVLQTCWPPGTTSERLLVFAKRIL